MAAVASGAVHLVQRLPAPVAVLLGLAALIAVAMPEIWSLVQHVGVIAHEGAHAFLSSSLGQQVDGVRLNTDGTGSTSIVGAAGSRMPATFIGYLGPSAFGLIAAALIAHNLIVAVLWTGVILLLILLPSVRGVFGVLLVAGAGALLFLVARYAPAFLEAMTAYALSWILLLGGVRTVLEHGTDASDAHALRRITHLPRPLWVSLWAVGSLLALAIGCTLLI
ncbi:MAG TPA: M50 family metallopeptidase [Streptosporangiaceae bacterium]|nr:M50 family metallopeptidase [Streptosporangiaceae bacterium]